MNRLLFKLGLFLFIWYEVAAEFCLSGDAAFVFGLIAFGVCAFAVRIAAHALGLLGPTTFGLLIQAVFWLGLFWWWAPPLVKAQPLMIVLGAAGLLGLGGCALRRFFDEAYARYGNNIWREHSTAVVIAVLAGLGACMVLSMRLHSLWGVAAYGLMVGLPVRLGWRMVPRLTDARADARMGTADGFRKAGYSEEQ